MKKPSETARYTSEYDWGNVKMKGDVEVRMQQDGLLRFQHHYFSSYQEAVRNRDAIKAQAIALSVLRDAE